MPQAPHPALSPQAGRGGRAARSPRLFSKSSIDAAFAVQRDVEALALFVGLRAQRDQHVDELSREDALRANAPDADPSPRRLLAALESARKEISRLL